LEVSAQRIYRKSSYNFQSGWYVGADAGFNNFLSEGIGNYSLIQSTGIMGRANIGYNLSPVLGLRTSVAYQLFNWPDTRLNSAVQTFGAQSVNVDLKFNVSNIFGPQRLGLYNIHRTFDISVLVVGELRIAKKLYSLPKTYLYSAWRITN
jgi:hypothetical protein